MALPASGAISLGAVNTELGVSATAARSLNDSTTRTLFGVASGAISLSNGYGKANQFAFTIASNQTNANLRTLAVNAGWNQSSKVVATINSGIYIGSNSTGTPALTVNGSFPNGLELTNNGFIIGMGGAGGAGGSVATNTINNGSAGNAGGLALSVSTAITITNNSVIGGGGGGGGGGAADQDNIDNYTASNYGGQGGGGGRTSPSAASSGGSGGSASAPGGWPVYAGTPGGSGSASAAGGGGASNGGDGQGGTGGTWGSSGSSGSGSVIPTRSGGAGGGGGAAISGNSNITYLTTGTRLGAIT